MECFFYAQIGSPEVPGEYMIPGGIIVFVSQAHIVKARSLGEKAVFRCTAFKKGGIVTEYKIVEITGMS